MKNGVMGHRSVGEVTDGREQGGSTFTGRVGGGIHRGQYGATTTGFPGGHEYGIAGGGLSDFSSYASLESLAL